MDIRELNVTLVGYIGNITLLIQIEKIFYWVEGSFINSSELNVTKVCFILNFTLLIQTAKSLIGTN